MNMREQYKPDYQTSEWAELWVDNLSEKYVFVSEHIPDHAIAEALRKAFADGIRRAVAMTDEDKWWELKPGQDFPDFMRNKYEREALAEAERIEGEAA